MSITMKFNGGSISAFHPCGAVYHSSSSGTAIYVFFIFANNAGDGITSSTLANFTLDSGNPELFQHTPDPTTADINYSRLVYSKLDLIRAEPTLVMSTWRKHRRLCQI
jgi:hypothetical protein